jgi:putative PIN family toxin of toxin-antitoxin system
MIRVVIDTNVYISALVFGGKPAVVLQLADSGVLQIVVSADIKDELVETLTGKFGWSAARAEQACRELWKDAYWVMRPQEVECSRDPDDNHILGCALESQARAIITGDQDLLVLNPFRGVVILAPSEFLARGSEAEV